MDAFASVHDMIHAAIASYGKQATLREVSTVKRTFCFRCQDMQLDSMICFVCRSTKPVNKGAALHTSAQGDRA